MATVRMIAHFTFDMDVDGEFAEYDEAELESFARDMVHDMVISAEDYVYEVYEEVV